MRAPLRMTLLLSLSLAVGGCWDHSPIESAAFIAAFGIDAGSAPDRVLLTQVLVVPQSAEQVSEGGGGIAGMTFRTMSNEGATFSSAQFAVLRQLPYSLQSNHAEIAVLGMEFARDGVGVAVEWLLRHPQVRPSISIVVSRESGQEFLTGTRILDPTAKNIVRNLLTAQTPAGSLFEVPLIQFARRILSERQDAVVPFVARAQDPGEGGIEVGPTDYVLEGLAVFKGDRMVGTLEGEAARGAVWLLVGKGGALSIPHPEHEHRSVGIVFVDAEPTLSVRLVGERLVVRIRVRAEGDVIEAGELVPLGVGSRLGQLIEAAEEMIAKEIRLAFERVQKELHADIFGVGEELYRAAPDDWHRLAERWDEVYAEAEVQVEVDVELRRTGLGR